MFRPKNPQSSLFEASFLIPPEKLERLKKSWAWSFNRLALPLINEESFRELYHQDNGRPNKPVSTVVGVLILKEMFDLTDEEALYRLDFDLGWQVALGLKPEEAHCCQKTLHNFRTNLIKAELGQFLFVDITDKIIDALGISVARQRLDSTHIISNIAILTRLGLFCETIRVFLRRLKRDFPEEFDCVPLKLRGRYLKDDGLDTGFGDARSSKTRRRLKVCARDVARLLELFLPDARIKALSEYHLLDRLFSDQCEVVAEPSTPEADDADAGEESAPIRLVEAKEVDSASLQSPHDPDVTYSGHKGKGYEVQVVETFGNEDKPEIITHVEVTPSCKSDADAPVPIIEKLAEREIAPDELLADTAYGSADNAIELEKRDVELVSPVPGKKIAPLQPEELNVGDFDVDAKGERGIRCASGIEAIEGGFDEESGLVEAVFKGELCDACEKRAKCPTKPDRKGNRKIRTTLDKVVIARRRRYESSEEFIKRYRDRSAIEGTNSELKRGHGLGILRVRGSPRVELSVYLKALACNVKRMVRFASKRPEPVMAMV